MATTTTAAPVGLARFRAALYVFVTLGAVAAALTTLFLGMRAVMNIGGFCAEGGPYVIQQHCPKGVPGLMVGSIWGGVIFLGLYIHACIRSHAPNLAMFAWPALFLSLGFNFLQYGIAPPFGGGLVWGWLVCGVVFVAMGGFPLLWFVAGSTWRPDAPPDPPQVGAATAARYWLVVQAAAIAAGVYAALLLYRAVTG